MERTYLRPSTNAYDGMNSIEEILGEYNGYTSILSDKDLKGEYENIRSAWLNSPTIMNIRMFELAKNKMLERGLMSPQNSNNEKGSEMYFQIKNIVNFAILDKNFKNRNGRD